MKNEAALIRAAKNHDRDAWMEIFDTYAPAIYRYVFRLCQDPIESDNIVGDVFSKLLERLAAGKGPISNLRSYIYEMAYHLIVDRARRNQRLVPLEAVIDTPTELIAKSTQALIEERALMDALIFALKTQLSELQRHVIFLRFLEDFSLRETAEIVGKNENHVKMIQNRGIAKLRKSLKRAF